MGWSGTPSLTCLLTQAYLAQPGRGDGQGLGLSQVVSLEMGWDVERDSQPCLAFWNGGDVGGQGPDRLTQPPVDQILAQPKLARI